MSETTTLPGDTWIKPQCVNVFFYLFDTANSINCTFVIRMHKSSTTSLITWLVNTLENIWFTRSGIDLVASIYQITDLIYIAILVCCTCVIWSIILPAASDCNFQILVTHLNN